MEFLDDDRTPIRRVCEQGSLRLVPWSLGLFAKARDEGDQAGRGGRPAAMPRARGERWRVHLPREGLEKTAEINHRTNHELYRSPDIQYKYARIVRGIAHRYDKALYACAVGVASVRRSLGFLLV